MEFHIIDEAPKSEQNNRTVTTVSHLRALALCKWKHKAISKFWKGLFVWRDVSFDSQEAVTKQSPSHFIDRSSKLCMNEVDNLCSNLCPDRLLIFKAMLSTFKIEILWNVCPSEF